MFNFADAYNEVKDSIEDGALPDSEYDIEVRRVKPKVTSGGKQALVVVMEVLDGPMKGRTLMDQQTWSPESEVAVRMFTGTMAVLGASREWVQANNPSPEALAERITGARARVSTKQEEFNGTVRNRVRFLKPLGRSAAAAEPAAQPLAASVAEHADVVSGDVSDPWG